MTQQYAPRPQFPPGTSVPVDSWLHADIQQRLRSGSKPDRADAERDAYFAQRFPAWQVYPVKSGRWRLKPYGLIEPGSGWGNDAISAFFFVLYLVYLVFWAVCWSLTGFGRWIKAPNVIQILDPATGRPIAEHIAHWRGSGYLDPSELDPNAPSTVLFLGDPRVAGLLGQATPQGPVAIAGLATRRERTWRAKLKQWTPQAIEGKAQSLIGTPYKEYSSYQCGPWLQDSPEAPKRGRTWWTRYRPS